MAKTHRGKALRKLPDYERGTCPVCSRTGVKLVGKVNQMTRTSKSASTAEVSSMNELLAAGSLFLQTGKA